jgi:hypothetical protein
MDPVRRWKKAVVWRGDAIKTINLQTDPDKELQEPAKGDDEAF